jgi:tRNA (guanine-N7-)-methyltransferase
MRKLSSLTLPWPTNWAALFGADRPLILEIGFGRGQFLFHLARQHPDHNLVGLEISNRCLTHVEDALGRNGIENVRVIHSTAETALHHLFEPATLTQVHINFPDPWFKPKHGHRRLMQRDTLDALVNRLAPGGLLYLATDIVEYAEMSDELLQATPGLENLLDVPWTASLPGRISTKYESKAVREGRSCYYFAYQRNNYPAPLLPVIKEWDMPHIVFSSPLTLPEMLKHFEPSDILDGETRISLLDGYQGRDSLLFEVFIKEPTIDQLIAFLLLARDKPHQYTLQLSSLGHPRPTSGVHKAAALLGDWLLSLHPDSRILINKVRDESD